MKDVRMRLHVPALVAFVVAACAPPQSHELFPWQLSCGETPDGMVGVIWNPEDDLSLSLGSEDVELAYFGVCNRTHRPLRMANLTFAQRPVSGALASSTVQPVSYMRVFRSGEDLAISAPAFFAGSWLNFVEDTTDSSDEFRRFTVVVASRPSTGELEFRIGNDDGTFADETAFSTDEGPVPLDRIFNNVAFTRHVSVTP